MRALLASLLATFGAWSAPALAQQCELHVWPTGQVSAVDKDNNVTFLGGGMGVSSTFTASPTVGRSIAEAIGPARQLELMRTFDFSQIDGLSRYTPIFHDGEVAPPDYPKQWLNKDFAQGDRASGSPSTCYAELHVVFVTYIDQPLKDTLHTIFVLRHFGDQPETRGVATDGGYHKASGVKWTGEEQVGAARQTLANSFSENLGKFFRRRKVKRLLGEMAAQ